MEKCENPENPENPENSENPDSDKLELKCITSVNNYNIIVELECSSKIMKIVQKNRIFKNRIS